MSQTQGMNGGKTTDRGIYRRGREWISAAAKEKRPATEPRCRQEVNLKKQTGPCTDWQLTNRRPAQEVTVAGKTYKDVGVVYGMAQESVFSERSPR